MAVKSWTGQTGGAWTTGTNWSPSGPPSASDDVILTGPASGVSELVIGPGTSGSMTLVNNTTLNGTFSTGALSVGTAAAQGALNLTAGALLNAASATLLYGPLQVSGANTRLVVSGALTLGGGRSTSLPLGSNLTVIGGGTVQAGSLTLAPLGAGVADTVYVDDSSSLEVGTSGGAAAGTLTVDAGRILSGAGILYASAGVANAGTILAQGGQLIVLGTVSGAGQLQIGAGGTLFLGGPGAPTLQPVSFTGPGGTLELVTDTYFDGTGVASGFSEQGVISGFAAGDTIFYGGSATITGAAFQPGSGGLGTLTLTSGTARAGTLSLAGDFSGYAFQVTPNGTSGSNITLIPTPAGGGGAPSAGTAAADTYSWTAAGGGTWGNAGNWRDVTASLSPSAIAPGIHDLVTLNGASGTTYETLTGPGNAATLTAIGNTALSGAFTTNSLAVGTAGDAGALSLGNATTLGAASATVLNGALQAAGSGTALTITGALTMGGTRTGTLTYAPNLLTAAAGATVQAGSLALVQAVTGGLNTISVDSASSLEIGAGGSPALGQITIDPGHLLSGAGAITAAGGINDGGIILAQGGTLILRSTVTGAGTLQIGANATLSLAGSAAPSTAPVSFSGAGGTLDIVTSFYIANGALASAPSAQGLISGFAPGDIINYAGNYIGASPLAAATYQPGSNGLGTLTLNSAAGVIGTLALAGNYAGYLFQVTPGANAGLNIGLVTAPPPSDPLFDAAYYLANNPDVAAAGVDPYQHFLQYGWHEGRNPSALFNTNFYLNQNPDVKAAGYNPLVHYETNGWKEGRDPSALFSTSAYLAHNPDVANAGFDPLLHYETNGHAEGRAIYAAAPHSTGPQDPLIDAAYVYAQRPDIATQGLDATAWFDSVGWTQGVNPDRYFDTTYYLTQNADVRNAGMNPLAHFETNGWMEGRDPSLVFSASKYLAANQDVAHAGYDPLVHYITNGQAEGRMTFLTGGLAAADPLVNAAYYDAQLGATILPTGTAAQQQAAASYAATGWQKGLNPDASFDTAYYLSHNLDVANAHFDPLAHYETNGWHEGRNPSAGFSTTKYLNAYPDVRGAGFDPLLHYVTNGQAEGRAIYPV